MAPTEDFYQVLDLRKKRHGREVTTAELKQAYKRALLAHHPDKQTPSLAIPGRTTATVDVITQAYKTLADPSLRAEYDRDLEATLRDSNDSSTRRDTLHTGMETMDLEDLNYAESSETWVRPCRCGSEPAFVITEAELEKNAEFGELIVGCKGCSLWLKVLFSVDG